jgi:predicted nucleotidyltransferase component of viral defense system
MLSIDEIKNTYPKHLQGFDRGLLREYLQYLILGIVFDHKYSRKLTFIGGTCLRIAYGSQRFSEDIDFDNADLTYREFEGLMDFLSFTLEKEGFIVEMIRKKKGAYHCYIKFPKLLYEQGLSPLPDEKILIQIDTTAQGLNYESEKFIIDRFEVFKQIKVVPKDVLLSQKLVTILERKRNKGRDFYDVMYLLQSTMPNEHVLTRWLNARDTREVILKVIEHSKTVDMGVMKNDVRPFLFRGEDVDRLDLFANFLKQKFEL